MPEGYLVFMTTCYFLLRGPDCKTIGRYSTLSRALAEARIHAGGVGRGATRTRNS